MSRKRPCTSIWTPEMDAEFIRYVPGHEEREIREHFRKLFGVTLTENQIGNRKHRLGVKSGTHGGCFKKGMGGFHSEEQKRRFLESGKDTRFKKGNVSRNVKPMYSVRITKDGLAMMKVREHKTDRKPNTYELRSRVVWEQFNGPIPKGCVIRHADGDKLNDQIANLRLLTQRENRWLNQRYVNDKLTADTFDSMLAMARLTIAIADKEKEANDGNDRQVQACRCPHGQGPDPERHEG